MPLNLISPVSNQCLEGDVPIIVEILNDGFEPIGGIPMRVRVRGAVNKNIYAIYQQVLEPGEVGQLQVGILNNLPYGEISISAETEMPNDTFHFNDKIGPFNFSNSGPLELPLPLMNFIGYYSNNLGEVYPGWYEARGKNHPLVAMDTDWQGGTYQGVRAANVYYAGLTTNDWMVSPKFTATTNLVVELKAAIEYVQGGNQMGSDDKLAIMVSEDCGENWKEIATINQSTGLTTVFQNYTFAIENYGGKDIIIAFYATTGNISNPQQYIIHITDISIKSLNNFDAGVTRVISPSASCSFGSEEPLIVEIKNFGQQTISNFDVAFNLNDTGNVVETVNQEIEYGQVIEYTFNATLNLTDSDIKQISVFTILQDDENPDNDGIYNVPLVLSSFDLATQGQYQMGFEPHENMEGWLVEDANNDNITWGLVNDPVHAHSGNFSFGFFSNQSSQPSNDWLFTPCFYLQQGVSYNISFYYKNRATNWPERLKLLLGQSQNGTSMNITLLDLGAISNSNYLKAEVVFSVPESGEYYFGWHAYGPADQFGMHIDDVTIYQVFENDLALVDFKAARVKDAECNIQGAQVIEVKVWNAGENAISEFDIHLSVDGEPFVEFPISQTIEPGEEEWISISNGFSLDAYTSYDLLFLVSNPSDNNPSNDTLKVNQYIHSSYYNGFEEHHEGLQNWTIQSLAGANQWHVYTGSGQANTGVKALAIRTDSAGGNTSNNDWAISDCFYLEAGKCYEISFFYRSWFSTENLKVYLGNDNYHSAMTTLLVDLPQFNSNAYLYVSQQFTVEETGVYYFGWYTTGGTSGRYYIFVDDISIAEDPGSQPVANPVKEILDLEVFFQANATNFSTLNWDFGDGNTSPLAEPFHVYQQTGNYQVTLTIGSGCVDVEYQFSVELECNMESDFSWVADGASVTFIASGDAAGYSWDFGDGNVAYGQEVSNIYNISGQQSFTVKQTAYFDCGSKLVEKNITVEPKFLTLAIIVEEPDLVSVFGQGQYQVGQNVTVQAQLAHGHPGLTFLGWFEGNQLLSTSLVYSFVMPNRDLEIRAVVDPGTSVNEIVKPIVSVFPNPARNQITISSKSLIKEVRLYDLSGKLVGNFKTNKQSTISVDLVSFRRGLYLVVVETDQGTTTEKIQIER